MEEPGSPRGAAPSSRPTSSDGAVWARTSEHGDDKDRVVVRSDGETTYFAADAAYYIRRKFARGFDHLVYVLGADRRGYISAPRGPAPRCSATHGNRVEVLIYQLVHLTKAAQARRCRNERSNIVFLDDFVDEIGVDAARWSLARPQPTDDGDRPRPRRRAEREKNPVYYVQYARARIAGILRNAEGHAVDAASKGALEPEERDLVKRLVAFPEVVREATDRRAPHTNPTSRDPRRRRVRIVLHPTLVCSRPSRSRSASRSARQRGTSSRRASTSSGSRGPSACSGAELAVQVARASPHERGIRPSLPPNRDLALELVRVAEAAAMGLLALDRTG